MKKNNNMRLSINIILYLSTFFCGYYILRVQGGSIEKTPILYYSPLTFYGISIWLYAILIAVATVIWDPLENEIKKILNAQKNILFILLLIVLIIVYIIANKFTALFGKMTNKELLDALIYFYSMAIYSVEPFFITLDITQIVKNKYQGKILKK